MDIKIKYSIGNTVYSIGDTVYTINDNAIMKCCIAYIKIEVGKDCKKYEKYKVSPMDNPYCVIDKDVSELFKTVDDLVKSFNL